MFLYLKQLAGASSGNKWLLFVATVAHGGAITKSAEYSLLRVSFVLYYRDAHPACFEIQDTTVL